MGQYIPDITERFPEGFGGVDMTPSYFGEPVDYSLAYGYEPTYEELVESGEIEEPKYFKVGQSYRVVGIYGGITTYVVKEIDRSKDRILLAEYWEDVDGSGTRPAEWHDLESDNEHNGDERALEWESKQYGKFWIYAE